MARDFRPKGARGKKAPRQDRHKKGEKSATGANSVVQAGTAKPRREWNKGAADVAVGTGQARDGKVASSALSSDDEDEVDEAVDDETLLREIKSMGGDEQDLDLIKKQSKAKGKAKASQASDDDDVSMIFAKLVIGEQVAHELSPFLVAGSWQRCSVLHEAARLQGRGRRGSQVGNRCEEPG